ncbi:FG-GAP repeat domain-containing protein [Jiangella alkaliphila]|uniref:Repeat domain-containing protein n=1 Tax=Jiangella alkaliphila TaxID=419479 RepID=A0A1H2LLX2_9ACTN|nr:VCBS repeat-containing protein [Jiangella alkaliphila]SDU81755.1 Repeat domain-containing protein [Jiangella alkaliphila]
MRRSLPLALAAVLMLGAAAVPSSAAPRLRPHRVADLDVAWSASARPQAARALAVPAPGDVTGDGLADAVVRDPGPDSGSLRVYAHDGSPAGANPWPSFDVTSGDWDYADVLQLADVTGDGLPDVVARDPDAGNGTLWIYPNDGSGGSDPWPSRVSAGTNWNTYDQIQLGDVTGDGRPDLLTREPGAAAGTLWIHPHNGTTAGNPWTRPRYWAGTGWNLATVMTPADVTGDGHADMVVRDGGGALWVYPHNGTTTANPYTSRYGAGTGWNLATILLTADATGDGRPDVVIRDGSGALWVYPHSGAAAGTNPYTVPRYAAGTGWDASDALLAGDVTGDGRADLLGRAHAGDLWVYPTDADAPGGPWPERFAAGTRWAFENALLLGDLTGDGRPDLLARDRAATNGTLWIYPNTGATDADPWTAPRYFAGTGWNTVTELVLGDLTGDGRPDVLARDRRGELWIYPHNGSTSSNPWTVTRRWAGSGWSTAATLKLADVDGDGRPDLVDHERDGTLWVYPTSGAAPVRIGGDWSDTDVLAAGDVTGDGRPDLVSRDAAGDLWLHPHDGATATDPWTAREPAGSGWEFASAFLL